MSQLCEECKRVGNPVCLHGAAFTMRAGYPSWSEIDALRETLRVVLETRGATFAAIGSALREIERRLLATGTTNARWLVVDSRTVVDVETVMRMRAEIVAAASAVANVAALVEMPLTTVVEVE